MDWYQLFGDGVINGLVLSLILTALMAVAGSVALDMFVDKYPPEIRDKYGPPSSLAARLRPAVAALVFAAVLAVPLTGLFLLPAAGSLGFWQAIVYAGTAAFVFNLYDLLVLDWLLFCTVRPRFMVLPGTEGMAAYRDYGFHFVGFLKGLVFTAVIGLLVAGLWTAVRWLF